MSAPQEPRDSAPIRIAEAVGRGTAASMASVGFGASLVWDSLYWLLLGRRHDQVVRARPVFAEMMEIGVPSTASRAIR